MLKWAHFCPLRLKTPTTTTTVIVRFWFWKWLEKTWHDQIETKEIQSLTNMSYLLTVAMLGLDNHCSGKGLANGRLHPHQSWHLEAAVISDEILYANLWVCSAVFLLPLFLKMICTYAWWNQTLAKWNREQRSTGSPRMSRLTDDLKIVDIWTKH